MNCIRKSHLSDLDWLIAGNWYIFLFFCFSFSYAYKLRASKWKWQLLFISWLKVMRQWIVLLLCINMPYSSGAVFHIRPDKRNSNECNMHTFIRIETECMEKVINRNAPLFCAKQSLRCRRVAIMICKYRIPNKFLSAPPLIYIVHVDFITQKYSNTRIPPSCLLHTCSAQWINIFFRMNFQHLTQTAYSIFGSGQNNDSDDREGERKNYPVVILIKTTSDDNFTPIFFLSLLCFTFMVNLLEKINIYEWIRNTYIMNSVARKG